MKEKTRNRDEFMAFVAILLVAGVILLFGFWLSNDPTYIRSQCIEDYHRNFNGWQDIELDCFTHQCNKIGANFSGRTNWYHAIIYCDGRNGTIRGVPYRDAKYQACRITAGYWKVLRECIDNKGAGY